MISQAELFRRVAAAWPDVRWVPAFPYVYGEVASATFDPDPDLRDDQVAAALSLAPSELRDTCARLFVRIDARRPDEPSSLPMPQPAFWLGSMLQGDAPPPAQPPDDLRFVHFYGFKGGQGRSSTLALLARALASDGWRILVLDLDAEAPSLDLLLGQRIERPEHTLVGVRGGLTARPLRAFPGERRGYVDLLAFAPAGDEYAADAASLAMEMALYPPGQGGLVRRLTTVFEGYDAVLIDHRTGLAPTVLPWVMALPGSVCLFARMDGQWRHSVSAVRGLWHHTQLPHGALLALAPPGTDRDAHKVAHREDAAAMLVGLADRLATEANDVDPLDLVAERFIVLPFDSNVAGGRVPSPSSQESGTPEAIGELRLALELLGGPTRPQEDAEPALAGDVSGGFSLETDALQQLLAENEIDWVVGRKGTGKTWLVRTLHERGRGEALLVPETDGDGFSGGLPARDLAVTRATDSGEGASHFWWALIAAGLQVGTGDREALRRAFKAALKQRDPTERVEELADSHTGRPRLLLIDGLELAFPPEHTLKYIEALVRVVHTIRSTTPLRAAVRLQVFVRTDLIEQGYENFEQIAQGRRLDLTWDHGSALNLLLATVLVTPWFATNFPEAVAELKALDQQLRRAEVPIGVCEDGLEQIFSERSGVTSMLTRSFWRTYFTDDPAGRSGFYPRLLINFVAQVAKLVAEATDGSGLEKVRGKVRIAPWVLAQAHAEVTQGAFLQAVLSELRWLLPKELRGEPLTQVVSALAGTATPFPLLKTATNIAKATKVQPEDVSRIFSQMRTLGMFEPTEVDSKEWRATRLYRTALRMKFRR